jgi:hypothetical protein
MLGGSLFPLVPDGGVDQLSTVLQPGETLQLSLSGQFVAADEAPFIAFIDAPTSAFLLAVRLQ